LSQKLLILKRSQTKKGHGSHSETDLLLLSYDSSDPLWLETFVADKLAMWCIWESLIRKTQ
jgi:hypothetical protein